MQFDENKIKYITNEKDRTIRGVYSFSPSGVETEIGNMLAKGFANQNVFKSLKVEPLHKPSQQWYSHAKTFSATAKCHPDDVFDVEIGKRIVKHRLILKFYAEKKAIMEEYMNIMRNQRLRMREALDCLNRGTMLVNDILAELEGVKDE